MRHWLYLYLPKRTANIAGFIFTALAVLIVTRDGVLDNLVAGLDRSYTFGQALFETAPPAPADPGITGSAASFIDWGAMRFSPFGYMWDWHSQTLLKSALTLLLKNSSARVTLNASNLS